MNKITLTLETNTMSQAQEVFRVGRLSVQSVCLNLSGASAKELEMPKLEREAEMFIPPQTNYVTAQTIAETKHIRPSTIYRWCYTGKIKSIKTGNTRLIDFESLLDFLAERK